MLDNTLNAIDNWLQQHAQRIARLSLRSPVSEAELLKLEALAGKPLPADFKRLYRWHNGLTDEKNTGSLFYSLDLWPISQVLAAYQARVAESNVLAIRKADLQLDASNLFNPGWIQFGSDGSRSGLFLDLAPSSTGVYGQVIFLDPTFEAGLLVANSITELATQFQADLENGLYSLEPDALEDGEHYLSCDAIIDLVNWPRSLRWRR